MLLGLALVVGIGFVRAGDGEDAWLAWFGGVLMVVLGLYGLTRRGAQKTAQSGRVSGGYAGMPAPKTVRGARIMSGALLACGVIALVLFATMGT